jgi:hypothetical protein
MRGEDTVGRKSYIYAEIGPFLTLFCAIAEELRLCAKVDLIAAADLKIRPNFGIAGIPKVIPEF